MLAMVSTFTRKERPVEQRSSLALASSIMRDEIMSRLSKRSAPSRVTKSSLR
jgi:hypothetical protein